MIMPKKTSSEPGDVGSSATAQAAFQAKNGTGAL